MRMDGTASSNSISSDQLYARLGTAWKVSNPLLIAATAVVGLIAYPILQPAWVMVK
jgi:hypothetical protein